MILSIKSSYILTLPKIKSPQFINIASGLSPIVLSKQGGKSAGRVQSVALKLVVEKEKEIQAFKSKEYYEIYLPFLKDGKLYRAQYKGTDAKKLTSVPTEKEAKEIVEECNGRQYLVDSITETNRKVKKEFAYDCC